MLTRARETKLNRDGSGMPGDGPDLNGKIPSWDVALEALLCDEARAGKAPLTLQDIMRLAASYRIRFDDMMVTLMELTVCGRWRYLRADGVPQIISQADLDRLYSKGRLNESHLAGFDGGWWPVYQPG